MIHIEGKDHHQLCGGTRLKRALVNYEHLHRPSLLTIIQMNENNRSLVDLTCGPGNLEHESQRLYFCITGYSFLAVVSRLCRRCIKTSLKSTCSLNCLRSIQILNYLDEGRGVTMWPNRQCKGPKTMDWTAAACT